MYAPLKREQYPLGWEELEYLEKKLRYMNTNYQVGAEKWVFSTPDGLPRYRYVVLKWGHNGTNFKRETLCETEDIRQACSVMTMLIAVAEDEKKEMESKYAGNHTNVQWN